MLKYYRRFKRVLQYWRSLFKRTHVKIKISVDEHEFLVRTADRMMMSDHAFKEPYMYSIESDHVVYGMDSGWSSNYEFITSDGDGSYDDERDVVDYLVENGDITQELHKEYSEMLDFRDRYRAGTLSKEVANDISKVAKIVYFDFDEVFDDFNISRVYFKTERKTSGHFLTREAAQAYLDALRHEAGENPCIFVEHCKRNNELYSIQRFIMKFADDRR